MARIIVLCFALIVAASANRILAAESIENLIENAFKSNSSNALVKKALCATDVTDEVATEFGIQGLWNGAQDRILANVNNLFACIRFEGFKGKRWLPFLFSEPKINFRKLLLAEKLFISHWFGTIFVFVFLFRCLAKEIIALGVSIDNFLTNLDIVCVFVKLLILNKNLFLSKNWFIHCSNR